MFLGKEPSCSVPDHPDVASEGLHRVLSWVALLGLPRSLLGAWISGFGWVCISLRLCGLERGQE